MIANFYCPRILKLAPLSLIILFSFFVISRYYNLITQNPEDLLSFIPDDAFYYIVLARNFTTYHAWTFDGGISQTSGFHPLWAYLLAAVLRLCEGVSEITTIKILMTLSVFLYTISGLIVIELLWKRVSILSSIAAIVPLVSLGNLRTSTMVMEWSILVLIYTLTVKFLIKNKYSINICIVLFFLGFLGSAARLDFGGSALIFFLSSLIIWRVTGNGIYRLPSFCLFAGALLGLISVLLHHYLFTGSLGSGSMVTKLFWSVQAGYRPERMLRYVAESAGFFSYEEWIGWRDSRTKGWLCICLMLATLAICGYFVLRAALRFEQPETAWHVLANGSIIVFYVIVYGINSAALQPWYNANIVIPSTIFLSIVFWSSIRWMPHFFQAIAVMALTPIIAANFGASLAPVWPHQRYMMRAGIEISRHLPDGNVGAWNAGILSFFGRRPIINLDGLVNDNAIRFIMSNRLNNYITNEMVVFIVDYAAMVEQAYFQRRGGYENNDLICRLLPLWTIPGSERTWAGSGLVVYRVRDSCVLNSDDGRP